MNQSDQFKTKLDDPDIKQIIKKCSDEEGTELEEDSRKFDKITDTNVDLMNVERNQEEKKKSKAQPHQALTQPGKIPTQDSWILPILDIFIKDWFRTTKSNGASTT